MKHFNTLTLVENEVIRLGEMRKLLAVIVNGMEGSTREEIESAIHYIEGSLSDISDNLSTNFQCLFEEIASTSLEKASTMMSDKGYEVGSLEDIPQRDGWDQRKANKDIV